MLYDINLKDRSLVLDYVHILKQTVILIDLSSRAYLCYLILELLIGSRVIIFLYLSTSLLIFIVKI